MEVSQMALTDEEQKLIDSTFTKKERKSLEKMVNQLQAIYLLTGRLANKDNRGDLYREWMHDSERFMGFMVSHSITLITLTKWLKWLTVGLMFLTIIHIIVILNNHYQLF
jgi:hypothetical protein